MARHPRLSIRRRLLIPLGLLFGVGMIALFVAARAYGRAAADESYDRLLAASALSIADGVSAPQGQWTVDIPYAALDLLAMARNDRVFYRVADPEGRSLTGYADLPAPPRAATAERAPHATPQATYYNATYRGEPVRVIALTRWFATADTRGAATVQVAQTRLARDDMAQKLLLRTLAPILFLTIAALALVWFGVDRALRPLARIEHDLQARDPSDLSAIRGDVPAELTQVASALNGFIARLAGNLDRLKAFIAEAAHQMRTPLAALHAQAQLAVEEDHDPAQQRRSLVVIERNAAHLVRLVNQLLSDATVSHRAALQRFEPFDLVRVIGEACDEALPRAEPRPLLELHCEIGSAPMRGDAMMLREALKNLIDNALRHGAGDRAAVELRLSQPQPRRFLLTVSDRGPGIDADTRAQMFVRFARGAGAAPGGAGLGLAIVQRVVESHGGQVTLHDRAGGGLSVALDLPERGA